MTLSHIPRSLQGPVRPGSCCPGDRDTGTWTRARTCQPVPAALHPLSRNITPHVRLLTTPDPGFEIHSHAHGTSPNRSCEGHRPLREPGLGPPTQELSSGPVLARLWGDLAGSLHQSECSRLWIHRPSLLPGCSPPAPGPPGRPGRRYSDPGTPAPPPIPCEAGSRIELLVLQRVSRVNIADGHPRPVENSEPGSGSRTSRWGRAR